MSVRQVGRSARHSLESMVKKNTSESTEPRVLAEVATPVILTALLACLMVVGWALSAT